MTALGHLRPFTLDQRRLCFPVRIGLRPSRNSGVRLEAEPDGRIVHYYGHGGSGVTFSWGCAEEVVARVVEFF
jgi:D-amino-acid oxidase